MKLRYWAFMVAVLAPAAAAAQDRAPLESRLDRQTLAELRPLLAQAARDSLPIRALEDKALEGAAKRVAPARIVDAVRQLGDQLREARGVLREAAPAAGLPDAEIVAAADARRRGVPGQEIGALFREFAPRSLIVPLAVLGDLVQRGVPADYARSVIQQLMAAGLPPDRLAELPGRVDVALRVGAPPLEALRSAVPGAPRPMLPQEPPAGAARGRPAERPGGQPRGGTPPTPGRPPGE